MPTRRPIAPRHPTRFRIPAAVGLMLAIACLLTRGAQDGEPQFDVFMGFDDRVREGHWFPVTFEIQNDGPAFDGTVILHPEGSPDSQRYSFTVDLPSGTRKRRVLSVFSTSGRYVRWEARLVDPRGTILAERMELQPTVTAASMPLLAALPKALGGMPVLPVPQYRAPELLPSVVRLQPDFLPDDPIALDGLSAWYLNSERAAELQPRQVEALLVWLHGGGHLIVGIEQPSDVTGLPWLRSLLPFQPSSQTQHRTGDSLDRWLTRGASPLTPMSVPTRQAAFAELEPNPAFHDTEITVVTGRVLDGTSLAHAGNDALIVAAPRGRGTVTVLAFSPERDPFRSWSHRASFWAKLAAVPPELLQPGVVPRRSGIGLDGLFGAMLDSRQVRKLPVGTLLLLLVLYLAVIGPFDRWVLKRIDRQMWTWITFPIYVALFAALIYFLGYRLRAGDLEWNEIQLVDQAPSPAGSTLRGRHWVSLYSPVNARYRFASEKPFSTLRSEFHPSGTGRGESGRLQLQHPPLGFEADAYVPVWVNQLYAGDWVQPGAPLLEGRMQIHPEGVRLVLVNRSSLSFEALRIAHDGRLHDLGSLAPGQDLDRILARDTGAALSGLWARFPEVVATVQQRRSAFGGEGSGLLERNLDGAILASLSQAPPDPRGPRREPIVVPAHFDLHRHLMLGDAVLFGWAPNQSFESPIHRFTPRRTRKDVVVRTVLPLLPASPAPDVP